MMNILRSITAFISKIWKQQGFIRVVSKISEDVQKHPFPNTAGKKEFYTGFSAKYTFIKRCKSFNLKEYLNTQEHCTIALKTSTTTKKIVMVTTTTTTVRTIATTKMRRHTCYSNK